jgi:pSer/pThr/pTyr-binding forkhead associated (FHA) protein
MRLIHQRGDERIAFPLDEGETFIGRKDDCDIYFPDTSLSKRHARLVRKGGALTVHDAGSKNGTLVNGDLITAPRALENGDVVQCGKLAFTVEGIGGEFDIIDSDGEGFRRSRQGSKGSRAAAGVPSESLRAMAKPVKSGEVRGSVVEEFPEVPADEEAAAAAGKPAARFRLIEGGEERAWDLTGETITVGSKPENLIVLSGEGISRYHAEVTHEGGKWLLKDLGARNGIFVAGKKIEQLHELQDKDEVQIGTAKLRFELVQASPLETAKELWTKFKADPVGTWKKEQRVRVAGMCVIAAITLLIIAFPSGEGQVSAFDERDLTWVREGTAKLQAGRYAEAKQIFGKAQAQMPSHLQNIPRSLTNMAGLWQELNDPMRFRWGKAEEVLLECARIENLPPETSAWISGQMETVRLNKEAYDKLSEAEGMGAQAAQLASERKFREALRKFELAILRYGEVSSQSAFAERARQQSAALRGQVYQLVLSEVRSLMQAQSPDWQGIVTFIGQGDAYAETNQQKNELRRLKEECETNQRDEDLYQRAVDVVSVRDVDNYPTATRLLERIDRRSRIYPDAQAYIHWIDADLKVRQAQRAYEQGDERRAFQLLTEAQNHDVLGPEARASVSQRRLTWSRVVTAYNRGMELFNAGKTREAQEEFERVIQLEPSRQNRYHSRAMAQLSHLQQLQNFNLERKMREGLAALQNEQYDEAYRYFGEVHRDPNRQARDLQRITEAVVNENRQRRLLRVQQQAFIRDQDDKFIQIYYVTKLLRRWLPDGDEHRADAEKLYQDVLKRLKTLQLIDGIEDDPLPGRGR